MCIDGHLINYSSFKAKKETFNGLQTIVYIYLDFSLCNNKGILDIFRSLGVKTQVTSSI